ncbi:MAG: hypothetical protein ABSF25_19825 [Bryobacteraceae bacterium]|jgi:hypothetical protein
MAGNNHSHDDLPKLPPDAPPPGHEEKDVDVWAVVRFAIVLVLLCAFTLTGLVGLFRYFQNREAALQPPQVEGADLKGPSLPPQPRLQNAPVLDLKRMRQEEDQILGSYGWIDRQKGIVRLPIARAIDLLSQRGLPARPEAGPQSEAKAVSVPTESGLGNAPLPEGSLGK